MSFVNSLDGYFWAPENGAGGAGFVWDTHDGGLSWQRPAALSGKLVLAVATGNHEVFVLLSGLMNDNCGFSPRHLCPDDVLERSPPASDHWSGLAVPLPASRWGATMTVFGPGVWVSGTPYPASGRYTDQTLVVSADGGDRFRVYGSPCGLQFGGRIAASSPKVLWADCPTGMNSAVFRSTDAGANWSVTLPQHEPNRYTALAPADPTTAVVEAGLNGQLLRTTDGGSTWQSVYPFMTSGRYWEWVGFTNAVSGLALQGALNPTQAEPSRPQLWRTRDGGKTWSGPMMLG